MELSELAQKRLEEAKQRTAARKRERREKAQKANVFTPGREVIWRPQPGPQTALVTCPYPEVLFGGARGGGKTDGVLGAWLYHAGKYGENARGIIFRRRFKQLEALQDRCSQLFPKLGALYNKGDATWVFPNGASMKLRHLWDEAACEEYQGHNYCVGAGTPILMWNGTHLPIEQVRPGDMVMTLEGPKVVQATHVVGKKPCVLAEVYDANGVFLGAQIHPESHPVLSSVVSQTEPRFSENQGVLLSPTRSLSEDVQEPHPFVRQDSSSLASEEVLLDDLLWSNAESPDKPFGDCSRNDGQQPESLPPWLSYTLLRSVHPESGETSACRADGRSGYKGSEHERAELPPLRPLCVPVVLCALHLQSDRPCSHFSMQSHSDGRFSEPLLRSNQEPSMESTDRPPLDGPSRSHLGRGMEPHAACDALDAPHGLRTVQDYPGRCPHDQNFYGEQPHEASKAFQVFSPLQDDVASQGRVEKRLDETDCIRECTRPVHSEYIHPYTRERRPLEVPVKLGKAVLSPCGEHLVYDLTVADANHYITETGLVNKNTYMVFEEATNWPSLGPIDKMRATLRSAHGVPTKMILTANPGGSGHNVIKMRYISPHRNGYQPIEDPETGEQRVFIPSRLEHNQILMRNDPFYERRLAQSGNASIVKAWRWGDWDVISGGFFDDLFNPDVHLLRPFDIPPTWKWRRSFDWGSAAPASLGIWAISDGTPVPDMDGFVFPRGSVIRVSEWYTVARDSQGIIRPNEGMRLTNIALGNGIAIRSQDRSFSGCVADPSIFAKPGRDSIYDEMQKGAKELGHHLIFQPADNNRIAGWQRIRDMLEAATAEYPEKPGLYAFETCEHYARTLPVMQRDDNSPDDINTDQEDHVVDEVRYLCATGARTLSIGVRRGE